MKRPSVKQSIKLQVSSNLADLPHICWQMYPPVLTSSGQIRQIYPRSAGRCTPILTSSGQIWQIYPRSASRCTPQLTSSDQE